VQLTEMTNKAIKHPKSQMTSVTDNAIKNSWWRLCV